MGGTGVLPFCGNNRFQLVITKRCPFCISQNDPTSDKWSVTIIRREDAREGRRSTMYTYLTDENGEIMCFSAPDLAIIPSTSPRGSFESLDYGTLFKLYNYSIPGYKSNLLFDLNYRLSMLIPSLAHPIRLRECRPGYSGHTFETTLSGLEARLVDDRQNNIEPGFPDSHQFNIHNQSFSCSIYLFLHGKSKNYRENDGILYIVNGQTQASTPDSFFNKANLSYLYQDLLILVDCSDLDIAHREDLFMNSRDRLRNVKLSKDIEERILEILKEHEGLKRLQNERRSAAIRDKIGDDRPLQNVIQSILEKSPVLSKILLSGSKLSSPFDLRANAGTGANFTGKRHPTFFKMIGNGKLTRPIKHSFRIQFETNAVNEYFSRTDDPGKLVVINNGLVCNSLIRHLGLFNGIATLTFNMPSDATPSASYEFHIYIEDECLPDTRNFQSTLQLSVTEDRILQTGGTSGTRLPPSDANVAGERLNQRELGIPNIIEVKKADWDSYSLSEYMALTIKLTDDNCDYFINMDNIHLLVELKSMNDATKIELTKARYKYSMVLIGMATMSYYKNMKDSEQEEYDIPLEVQKVTSILSPVLIPMLDSMSDLNISMEQEQRS